MNKLLPIFITIFVLLLSPNVFAQDASSKAATVTPREKLLQNKEQIAKKIENRQEIIASKAAQLKLKIQAFKDQRKAERVQRISDNLNKINTNRTEQMSKNLEIMTDILNKLGSSGGQTSSASAAITNAKTAVTVQAQKDYTIQVTTEAKAKIDAKATYDQLATDLQTTRKLVIAAKQSLMEAIQAARPLEGPNGQ